MNKHSSSHMFSLSLFHAPSPIQQKPQTPMIRFPPHERGAKRCPQRAQPILQLPVGHWITRSSISCPKRALERSPPTGSPTSVPSRPTSSNWGRCPSHRAKSRFRKRSKRLPISRAILIHKAPQRGLQSTPISWARELDPRTGITQEWMEHVMSSLGTKRQSKEVGSLKTINNTFTNGPINLGGNKTSKMTPWLKPPIVLCHPERCLFIKLGCCLWMKINFSLKDPSTEDEAQPTWLERPDPVSRLRVRNHRIELTRNLDLSKVVSVVTRNWNCLNLVAILEQDQLGLLETNPEPSPSKTNSQWPEMTNKEALENGRLSRNRFRDWGKYLAKENDLANDYYMWSINFKLICAEVCESVRNHQSFRSGSKWF